MKIRDIVESITLQEAPAPDVLTFLKQANLNTLVKGNKVEVLVEPPAKGKDEFRLAVLKKILQKAQTDLADLQPHYDPIGSSIGRIAFGDSPTQIYVKDSGKKGDKSNGKGNELAIANKIQEVIKNHGYANVSFVDEHGRQLKLSTVTEVDVSGLASGTRKHGGNIKKADVVLRSSTGHLPISIKQVDAEYYESADTYYGAKAGAIIKKLLNEGHIQLLKTDKPGIFKLSKEIVVEPTEQEALDVLFGSDVNPDGGIVIQTFQEEHYAQDGAEIVVNCHAVVKSKEDLPQSHLVMWLIRNDSSRNNVNIGVPGVRVYAAAYRRAIGKGNKNIALVSADGKVLKS